MRILFDMCVYDMRNKGNVALLQVAVRRMQERWPQATMRVISISPHILKLYCPTADPIGPDGYDWLATDRPTDRILRAVPGSLFKLMFEIREEVWDRAPAHFSSLGKVGARSGPAAKDSAIDVALTLQDNSKMKNGRGGTYSELLKGTDLFVATGAQYMSDACKPDALELLGRLEEAHRMRIPTVMVGQGIGPIHDPQLRQRAAEVLPLVDLIFVRETLTAPTILESLGVSPDKIIFTGDDAIELAYQLRNQSFGKALGASIRLAPYTEVDPQQLDSLRRALAMAQRRYNASLIPIPISHSAHERDDEVLRNLDVRREAISLNRFETPAELVRRVGRCRVVVTGTYHGAVFALAQGIPAVGLAQSEMYFDKFRGLAEQFGNGCQIVRLDDTQFPQRTAEAIKELWLSAESLRPQLLASSARQIELGRSAYQRIHALVGS